MLVLKAEGTSRDEELWPPDPELSVASGIQRVVHEDLSGRFLTMLPFGAGRRFGASRGGAAGEGTSRTITGSDSTGTMLRS